MTGALRSFALPLALLLAAGVPGAAAETAAAADLPATTVAIVNGEAITLEDLEKKLEEMHGEVGPAERSVADPQRLLDRLVNDVLIGQEARALGMHEESPVPESVERNRQRLAVALLEREELSGPSAPTPEEVAGLFRERYGRATFRVLTATDIEGAEAIVTALRDGVDVETVAREMSIDPYAESGGLVENVTRKDLQISIADVVFALSPKEVAGPVETDLGWSIVIAEEFGEPDPELLDEVRDRLERILRQRKEAAAREALFERLRRRHDVAVDQELVASIQPVRRADGRLTVESPGPDEVVARIGEEITLSADDYAVALERRWRSIPDEEAARAAAPIIFENLVNQRLQLAEAYARGYQELPAVRRALHGFETELLIPRYLSSVLAAGLEITEEEKRAEYERTRERLRRPPRVRFGQITVPSREQAEAIASALRAGSDLAWLARQHSTDGLREKGGLQEWRVIQPDGGPISAKMIEAAPGTTLDPIQEEESWVVYQVVAREELGIYSYDEVSGNMREAVFRRRFTEILDRFLKTARSRSKIEIREEVLAGMLLSGSQEEAAQTPQGGAHGGRNP